MRRRRRQSARQLLVAGDLPSLRLDRAQARIEHRGVDEVDRAAAAREALAGAQPVDGAEQIAERVARLGLGADRAQRHAEPGPGLAERAPGERIAPDAPRPRSAARPRSPSGSAFSGATAGVASRAICASSRSARPRAVGGVGLDRLGGLRRRAAIELRLRLHQHDRALGARAAVRAGASDRQRAGERRVGTRPVAQQGRGERALGQGAQLVGGAALAVGVARLPSAQRVDARVHEDARARLRDGVLEHAHRRAGRRRCRRARAPRRCARPSAGGCAGRGSRRSR